MFSAKPRRTDFPSQASLESVRLLLNLILDEILEVAPEEQVAGFMSAVGTRLAALEPLKGLRNVEEIETAINAIWQHLGWGKVVFELDDEGVDIFHYNPPLTTNETSSIPWDRIIAPLLEGAYGQWFSSLSESAELSTRATKATPGLIELRHAP